MSIAKQIADMSGGRVTEEDVKYWFPSARSVTLGIGLLIVEGEFDQPGEHSFGFEYRRFYSVKDMISAIEKHRDSKKPADNRTWQEKVEAAVKAWNNTLAKPWVLVGDNRWGGEWAQYARTNEAITIHKAGAPRIFYFCKDWTIGDVCAYNNELVDCLHAEGLTGYRKYRQVD